MLTYFCFVVLAVQLLYLSVFLFQFVSYKNESPAVSREPASIIVCAHDEEENLRELIPLLLAQNYPEFEVIIVEDRCNDGTLDYLMEMVLQHPALRMVRVSHLPSHVNGKKFGITLGIRAAKHEWVLLTDADCRPDGPGWVAGMANHFTASSKIVIGFSPYDRLPGLLNSFIRFETLITGIQYMGLALAGMPYMGVGRNLAYRKSLFLESKGFNNHLGVMGGDDDLFVNEHATSGNTCVAIGESVLVHSKPKQTFKEFYVQKIRHLSVGKRYKFSTRVVLGFFSLSWMLVWLVVLPFAAFSPFFYWILGAVVVRWTIMAMLVRVASVKLGDAFEAWKTPFLEFIYAFYYLVAGGVAFISKKVRWKI